MTGWRRVAPVALGVLVVISVTGLALGSQRSTDDVQAIDEVDVPFGLLDRSPAPSTTITAEPTRTGTTLFLVMGTGLVSVERPRKELDTPLEVLRLLLSGPTKTETDAGLRTSVPPETELLRANLKTSTLEVDLAEPFETRAGGEARYLGIAQLVYTATALPGVRQVRFLLTGEPVDVPTGSGTLTRKAVDRTDYPVPIR